MYNSFLYERILSNFNFKNILKGSRRCATKLRVVLLSTLVSRKWSLLLFSAQTILAAIRQGGTEQGSGEGGAEEGAGGKGAENSSALPQQTGKQSAFSPFQHLGSSQLAIDCCTISAS